MHALSAPPPPPQSPQPSAKRHSAPVAMQCAVAVARGAASLGRGGRAMGQATPPTPSRQRGRDAGGDRTGAADAVVVRHEEPMMAEGW
eukprot:6938723-Prymnesium_polylepis.1